MKSLCVHVRMPSHAVPNPPQIEVTGAVGGSWCVYNLSQTLGVGGWGSAGAIRLATVGRDATVSEDCDRSNETKIDFSFFGWTEKVKVSVGKSAQ